jgi:ribosomal protein S18 acetylase RimI-like enzyme
VLTGPFARTECGMGDRAEFRLEPVRSAADIEAVAGLFAAYAESLGIDLTFQGFEAELASLPGDYAPPEGELLLARLSGGKPAGCVGIRPLDGDMCEMKRLYVPPAARGLGLGKALAVAIIAKAVELGYREIRLDTFPSMTAAIGLYKAAGFRIIPPYYDNPISGAIFMALRISEQGRT